MIYYIWEHVSYWQTFLTNAVFMVNIKNSVHFKFWIIFFIKSIWYNNLMKKKEFYISGKKTEIKIIKQ